MDIAHDDLPGTFLIEKYVKHYRGCILPFIKEHDVTIKPRFEELVFLEIEFMGDRDLSRIHLCQQLSRTINDSVLMLPDKASASGFGDEARVIQVCYF